MSTSLPLSLSLCGGVHAYESDDVEDDIAEEGPARHFERREEGDAADAHGGDEDARADHAAHRQVGRVGLGRREGAEQIWCAVAQRQQRHARNVLRQLCGHQGGCE
jgi:hypothetical protein